MQISSDYVQFVNQLVAIGIPMTLVAIIGNTLLFGFCLKSIIGKTSSCYHRIIRGLDLQRPASSNYGCVIDMNERLNLNEIDEIVQKKVGCHIRQIG